MWDVTGAWRGNGGGVATTLASVIRGVDAHLVGIAGPPGGGKSTFARSVADELGDALVVSLDDYYLSQKERHDLGLRWRGPPGSHDLVSLLGLLDRIRDGSGPIAVQRFSADIDDRIEPITLPSIPPHVLLEGWVLGHRDNGYEPILDSLDLFVFLDIDEKIARARRFAREARLRERGGGFSEDEMQRFWDEVLEPGMQRWVRAARERADLLIEVDASDALLSARTTSEAVVSALEDR